MPAATAAVATRTPTQPEPKLCAADAAGAVESAGAAVSSAAPVASAVESAVPSAVVPAGGVMLHIPFHAFSRHSSVSQACHLEVSAPVLL